jgi:hypothetical protein
MTPELSNILSMSRSSDLYNRGWNVLYAAYSKVICDAQYRDLARDLYGKILDL